MKRRVVSNKRILILCEGITEEVYAKSLRSFFLSRKLQRVVSVEVVRHKKNDPLNLVLEAKKRVYQAKKERQPYQSVWLFFDHDNSPHLEKVFEEINKNGYKSAFSAISIEFWFLLHFEDNGKAFSNGDECRKYLLKHWPAYHKTKVNHFSKLKDSLELALDRADRLEKRNSGINVLEAQPYTSVHHLIEMFKTLN